MADNLGVTPGTGATIAADDVGGALHQRVKLALGADGTAEDMRGNIEGTLLASAARTATTGTSAQTNYNARGVMLHLDVTSVGTGTLQLELICYGGVQYATLAQGTAVATSTVLLCYPGIIDADFLYDARSIALPRTWLASVTKSNASSWTFSLGYVLIV